MGGFVRTCTEEVSLAFSIYYTVFLLSPALIVQWLGHLVVAEKTWVRFPLGAHNTLCEEIAGGTLLSRVPKLILPHPRSHRFFSSVHELQK